MFQTLQPRFAREQRIQMWKKQSKLACPRIRDALSTEVHLTSLEVYHMKSAQHPLNFKRLNENAQSLARRHFNLIFCTFMPSPAPALSHEVTATHQTHRNSLCSRITIIIFCFSLWAHRHHHVSQSCLARELNTNCTVSIYTTPRARFNVFQSSFTREILRSRN